MAIYKNELLDQTFYALGDSSRRRMLEVISKTGSQTASELVDLFDFAQPTISKHLKVLESAGLVERHIEGRVHRFSMGKQMGSAKGWIDRHLMIWEKNLDRLEKLLDEDKPAPKNKKEKR